MEPGQQVNTQDHGNQAQRTKNEEEDSGPISASGNRRDEQGVNSEEHELHHYRAWEQWGGMGCYKEGVKDVNAESNPQDRDGQLNCGRLG
jgi:hypothetical protein